MELFWSEKKSTHISSTLVAQCSNMFFHITFCCIRISISDYSHHIARFVSSPNYSEKKSYIKKQPFGGHYQDIPHSIVEIKLDFRV